MANYSLVANSTFQPFSYAELLAPVMAMSNYHEKLAQEYDNLSKQADVLEAMGTNDRDKSSNSYSNYKSYSDALRNEADNLYQYGLNTESRRRLTDLRRRYNTDIVPIQNAWSKREKEADEQMKASLSNPSLMFTRDAKSTSLDDYVKNPTGGYGVINGANITAQMGAMAKNLEKQILDGSARKETIDPYTYSYIRKYGLTPDMVRDWRNNPTLSKMFEQVMQANGVTPEALNGSLNAQSIIDKSTGYAEMGMWNAIGEDKAEKIENYGARYRLQHPEQNYSNLPSPYPVVSQDMPLILGDTSDRKKSEKLATTLGFGAAGGNGEHKEKLEGSLFGVGRAGIIPSTYSPQSSRPNSRVVEGMRLFNPETGKMMTKKQFISQEGSNSNNRSSLATWYDENVSPALKHFGFAAEDTPTPDEFEAAYKKRYDSSAAGYVKSIDITHDDAEDWRKIGSSNAYPVSSYDKKKGMIASSNAVKLGTLLDKVKSKKGNINRTVITEYQGQPALLFEYMEGEKVTPYQVPLDMGNAMVRRALSKLSNAEVAAQTAQDESVAPEYRRLAAQKAQEFMEAGFGDLNNFLLTYKKPTANTYKQPTDKELGE